MSNEVAPKQYSDFAIACQRVNNATFGIVNPANVETACGIALAWDGSPELDTWGGILETGAAFMVDVADGFTARRLGVAGKFGAAFDAIADKIKVTKSFYHIWNNDQAPKPVLVAVGLQNAANIGLTVLDKVINEESDFEVSINGKKAMALQVGGIGIAVIGNKLRETEPAIGSAVKLGGTALGFYGFFKYGIPATKDYWQTIKRGKRRTVESIVETLLGPAE